MPGRSRNAACGRGALRPGLRASAELPAPGNCWAAGRYRKALPGLQQAGRLELSLEALVTAGKYGQLFTDEEVNCCFAALCDAGFYVWNHTP